VATQAGTRLERAVEQLAVAADAVARGGELRPALQAIAEAVASATGADLVAVRLLDAAEGRLSAAAVAARSAARAAEVEGTHFPAEELPEDEVGEVAHLPRGARGLADRLGAEGVLLLPVRAGGEPVACLEVLRVAESLSSEEKALARLAAAHVAVCVRADRGAASEHSWPGADVLELAGEALAAASEEAGDPQRLAALAASTWRADAAYLWQVEEVGPPALLAAVGLGGATNGSARARALAGSGLRSGEGLVLERSRSALPKGFALSAVVPLGRPPSGALQLLFASGNVPPEGRFERLASFGASTGRLLRAADRSRALSFELERSRALLGVIRRATAELSLAHTLATALERIAFLLGVPRVAVYLREGEELQAVAEQGLAGPHPRVAARLLELALGPGRARGALVVEQARRDPALASVRQAVEETDIESALAAPLVASEEVIGLLAAYPEGRRRADEHELDLLGALAGHLAVAVQNARLHEQAKELGRRVEEALAAESAERRRLDALYEVSRSFTQSLSMDATVEAVTRAAVDSLGVDAAVLRVPDARGETLVTQALSVRDTRLEAVLRSMLSGAAVISRARLQGFFRRGQPVRLDPQSAARLGGSFGLLEPFLEKGSTAVVVPVSTPDEIFATLTLLSLDPAEPIDDETIVVARSLAGQAALAIDHARLYQQQKQFSDSMQRALLPREHPAVPGLELGVVYESSAHVDVGGDLYDFLVLDDGRLALVLGDVTGHGVDAAADMAMAKFVFRSLAREHPEPAEFLRYANDVVAEEIAPGKFITLLYLTFDPATGEVAGAAAGHPPPRLLEAGGTVAELEMAGLALGIQPGQGYEEVRRGLAAGDAVVLYTDGVVEARDRRGQLYGDERLDALLAAQQELPAQALAEAVVEDARRYGGGELADDCAVVVVRRTP
jgi:serine phosphatase RsbU (regulator of sigma subunit)